MEGVREMGVRREGQGLRGRREHRKEGLRGRRRSLLRCRQRAGRRGLRGGRGERPRPVSGCKGRGKRTEI